MSPAHRPPRRPPPWRAGCSARRSPAAGASYRCGSVWPHHTAIALQGLVRYGFLDEAVRLARGLTDAARLLHGRLPELVAGLSREDAPFPVLLDLAARPQAWAAAATVAAVDVLLDAREGRRG